MEINREKNLPAETRMQIQTVQTSIMLGVLGVSNTCPSIAQLVERRTVVGSSRSSLGRWFESGSKDTVLTHKDISRTGLMGRYYYLNPSYLEDGRARRCHARTSGVADTASPIRASNPSFCASSSFGFRTRPGQGEGHVRGEALQRRHVKGPRRFSPSSAPGRSLAGSADAGTGGKPGVSERAPT